MAILPPQWSKNIYFYQKALYGDNAKWISEPPEDYTGKWVIWLSYDTDERIVSHYKNGQLHGHYEQFNETGNRFISSYYENGKKNGLSIMTDFYNNDIIREHVLYVADVPWTGYITNNKQRVYIIEHERLPEENYREWEKITGGIKAFIDDSGNWKIQNLPKIHLISLDYSLVTKINTLAFPAPIKHFTGEWIVYDNKGYTILKQNYNDGLPSGRRIVISTHDYFVRQLSYYDDGMKHGMSIKKMPLYDLISYKNKFKNTNIYQVIKDRDELLVEFCLYKNSFPYLGMFCRDYYEEDFTYHCTMHYVIDGDVIDDFDVFKDKFTKKYLPLLFRYGTNISTHGVVQKDGQPGAPGS